MRKLVLLFVLAPLFAGAQSLEYKADELLTAYTSQNKFSGVVLIAKDGQPIFEKAYGYADRERNLPNTVQTQFRVGSLTKMFTATAVLQLVEQSAIALDDPISKYIPAFPDGDKIKIVHLLSHTSGIKGRGALNPHSLKEQVEGFRSEGLEFTPGERFAYNNFNYILLSYIIELVTGTPYPVWLQGHVLQRAGMYHSGLDSGSRISPAKATGYITNPATLAWMPTDGSHVADASGAGALYSTAEDLLQWAKVIGGHQLLAEATFQKAWTVVKGNYGLGWMLQEQDGKKELGHTGSIPGFIAAFFTYPETHTTLIILSNYGEVNGRELCEKVKAVVFLHPYSLPVQKKEISLPMDILQQYAGRYRLNDQFIVTVSVENNKLYALAPGDQDKVEFTAEAIDRFFMKGPETEVEFQRREGKVTGMTVKQGGNMVFTKMD
jgi:CubicO group peptidase (beta-lactamase class C family)